MKKKHEIFLTLVYAFNLVLCIYTKNWVAVMGWGCALLAQLRIMDIIKID